jgi:hypothetical protein
MLGFEEQVRRVHWHCLLWFFNAFLLIKNTAEVMKRSGRGEPMWVAIHKCMEATLGIFLYSYPYLN